VAWVWRILLMLLDFCPKATGEYGVNCTLLFVHAAGLSFTPPAWRRARHSKKTMACVSVSWENPAA
jgi:hypothetical protein